MRLPIINQGADAGRAGPDAVSLADPPNDPSPGMAARLREFGSSVQFYAPGLKRWQTSEWKPSSPDRFVSISVTGSACALKCDHCDSKVLDGMAKVGKGASLFDRAAALAERGTEGILVSGGSTKTGEVPFDAHFEDMRRITHELGLKVIVHSGVVRPRAAAKLAEVGVYGVMLDIIGADETIRDVYHLDLRAEDFERSLEHLAAKDLRIIPHIVLGLHYGRFLGEARALEMIRRHPVSTLILVVLTPLVGTAMEGLAPPDLEETADFFARARERMPDTKVNLGCGRPMGPLKVALDKAAIDHGLNGIAYPAEGIVDYARRSGLVPDLHESCCSLTWEE